MKTTKRILSLLLILCMLFSLTVLASAKTSSEEIPAPAGGTTVFTISAGSKSAGFTWDEISGKGDFAPFTASYAAKVDGEQTTQEWTGVKLADLLAAAGTKLGLTLADDYKLSAFAADGFKSVFTVGDVKDADNAYMVAPDPVKNFDGETVYPDSYVRILINAETSNKANIRCVTGLEILDASGNPISTGSAGTKAAGGDVANAVFYIAVKESAESDYVFYYYTREELAAYGDTYDFKYVDHSVPKTVTGRGASLKNLLADLADSNVTDEMIVQYAESDGYHADAKTAIEDSAYKDKVAWLGADHVTAGGETAAAVETMVCLDTWTVYDTPDENNVNSTEWEDADLNSGYLRAYRQRGDANSAVIKTLMGAVVSFDGAQFTGKDGYTLSAVSVEGNAMRIIEPSTGIAYTNQKVTGLVPGMQWTVKAPVIAGAEVSGEASKTVTCAEGTSAKAEFTYKENDYLTVNGKVYTLSALEALDAATQTPTAEEISAHGTPYGYYNAMYYRYNGVWLKDLVSGDVTVTAADGTTPSIPAAELDKYFVETGWTNSKSSTNVSEGKRYTYACAAPQLIIPGDGTLVGEAEAGAEGNSKVTVAMEAVASVEGGEPQGAAFNDIAGFPWAEEAINALHDMGVVNGIGGGAFGPDANIIRGDFMLMLARAYDLKAEEGADNFADVPAGKYYGDAIAAAKALGIAKGDGTNFYPESNITRQEAMTLLYRTMTALGKTVPAGDLSAFSDAADVADYAAEPIGALVAAGVIKGADGKVLPTAFMTRAQMAVALYRALNIK